MKLRYTPRAAFELDFILTEIATQSPNGARRIQQRVRKIIELLLEHPKSGRRAGSKRLRRIVVTPFPYQIFYEATEDEIIIIGVRHGARKPSSMPR